MSKTKILLVVFLFLGLAALARAETKTESTKVEESVPKALVSMEAKSATPQEAEFKKTTEKKIISGVVAGISPYFLAVDIGVDEKAATTLEMAMSVDKDTKVKFKNNLKEIANGDTVQVTYEETKATNGKITKVLSRIAQEINFVKAGEVIKAQNPLQSTAQAVETPVEP